MKSSLQFDIGYFMLLASLPHLRQFDANSTSFQADVAGINITSTEEPYAPPCPDDHCDGDKSPFATATNLSGLSRKEVVIFVVGAILFTLLGVEIGRWSTT